MSNRLVAIVAGIALAVTFRVTFPAVLSAQQSSARPRSIADTLIQLERKSWVAWKARDSAFYRQFLSDDHVELGFGGRSDKADVVATVATSHCVVASYSVEDFKATQFDANMVVLTYHASQSTTCSGKPVPSPVWVSSTYVRRGNRWLNAVYQQTQDTRK
jgi:hypothetical protein